MNLRALTSGAVAAINPKIPVALQISIGSTRGADGVQTPAYATPGAITASITGTVLDATAVSQGSLQVGQSLADLTDAILPGTTITELLTGTGGAGTYAVNQPQTVLSEAMTTSMSLTAQIQPITWRDLQQLEGLSLGGVRWKAYLFGEVDAIVRPERKGGDLIVISTGRHQGTWLVGQVLEQYPDWVCAAITQQNGS